MFSLFSKPILLEAVRIYGPITMLNMLLLFPSVFAEPYERTDGSEQKGWGWNPVHWSRRRDEDCAKQEQMAARNLSSSALSAWDGAAGTVKGTVAAGSLFYAPWYWGLVKAAGLLPKDTAKRIRRYLPSRLSPDNPPDKADETKRAHDTLKAIKVFKKKLKKKIIETQKVISVLSRLYPDESLPLTEDEIFTDKGVQWLHKAFQKEKLDNERKNTLWRTRLAVERIVEEEARNPIEREFEQLRALCNINSTSPSPRIARLLDGTSGPTNERI